MSVPVGPYVSLSHLTMQREWLRKKVAFLARGFTGQASSL